MITGRKTNNETVIFYWQSLCAILPKKIVGYAFYEAANLGTVDYQLEYL
jgi:hypothetical protein